MWMDCWPRKAFCGYDFFPSWSSR